MDGPIRYDRRIFAENLRRLMKLSGEKQTDVARLLRVSKSTLSAYCKGEQMPRMDKVEILAHHYGVGREALLGEGGAAAQLTGRAPEPQIVTVYNSLNDEGQTELLRYGRYLGGREEYRAAESAGRVTYLKHYLVPAAAGYASPIEGEDYELLARGPDTPEGADFAITVRGDSMEPFIPDGSLVYVRRDAPLREFEAGVFYVDGDVYCKQWCVDYEGTLHLLSANPKRRDANLSIPRDAPRSVVCFGKVLLNRKLPQPSYW